MTKDCQGCGESKPVRAFYQYAGKPYGPCKVCRTAKARDRYAAQAGELQYLRTVVAAIGAQVPYLGSDLA